MGEGKGALIFIALVVLTITLQALQSFVRPLVIAFILTILLQPLFKFLVRQRIPKSVILGGVAIIVFGFILIAHLGVGTQSTALSDSQEVLEDNIEENTDMLNKVAVSLLSLEGNKRLDEAKITTLVTNTVKSIVGIAKSIIGEAVMVLLFLVFVIPSYKPLIKDIEALAKSTTAKRELRGTIRDIEESIQSYIFTKAIMSLILAVCCALVLWLFGAKLILLIAAIFFAFNFIPNIGATIAAVIAAGLQAILLGPSMSILWLFIILFVVQFVFGSIIEPKLLGEKLGLSPLIIILSLFFWGFVWGPVGMLLAVPLMSIISILLGHFESTKNIARFLS